MQWWRKSLHPHCKLRGLLCVPPLVHLGVARACEHSSIAPTQVVIPNNNNAKNNNNTNNNQYDFHTMILSVLKAGNFASGLLILATQIDLWLEFGGHAVQLGESESSDFVYSLLTRN
jgi:hypothetical protein